MDELDPRVEDKKQIALKFDYILDNYHTATEVAKIFNIYDSYLTRLRNPKNPSTLSKKRIKELEEKLDIPQDIFYKTHTFNPKTIDEQIIKYREKITHKKEKKKSLLSLHINTQLTIQAERDSLIGRKRELKEIETLLAKNSVVWIYGIGGIGKSAFISYYLYKQKKYFDYYGFFEGIESFTDELKLSLKLKSDKSEELFREAIIKLRKLNGLKILVIDNIEEVEPYQKEINIIIGLKEYGYTIIFSSREIIEEITTYRLDALHNDDARKLFNSIYKIPKYKNLTEILNYLDYHPLFIELTAKALKNKTTLTPTKLKEKFNNGEFPKVNIKRKESFHNYLNKLFSFDNLDSEEILTLKKLSALPSIDIEFNFLEKLFNIEDEEEFEEILNYLVEKGWLNHENESYKLHQVIKEYILEFHLPQYQEIEEIINFFIQSTLNSIDSQVAIDNRNSSIYFYSLYSIIEKINIKNSQVSLLFTHIGNIYYFLTPNRAKPFYLKALEISEALHGTYHLDTATAYYSLAIFYESQSEYAKAKKFYNKALEINRELFGEENISLAPIYNGLAELYHRDKNFNKAEALYLKALDISEKSFGLKHLETSTSYSNIANLYMSMNLYEKAIYYFSKDLRIIIEIFGESHLNIAISYHNLAGLCWKLQQYDQAEEYYQKALKIKIQLLGQNHLSTLNTERNLAILYHAMKKIDKAYLLLEKVVQAYKTILPPNHDDLIDSKKSLDIIQRLQKKGK